MDGTTTPQTQPKSTVCNAIRQRTSTPTSLSPNVFVKATTIGIPLKKAVCCARSPSVTIPFKAQTTGLNARVTAQLSMLVRLD